MVNRMSQTTAASINLKGQTCVAIPHESPYHVRLPACDYLLIVLGVSKAREGKPLEHPRLLRRNERTFEFKHSAESGRKWWTRMNGIEYWFAIPKERIELVLEAGYSYPRVVIGGVSFRLNVSGGTDPDVRGGWSDHIGSGTFPVAHGPVGLKKRDIRAIAACGLPHEECARRGIVLPPIETL